MVFSTSFDSSSTVQRNTTLIIATGEHTLGSSPPVWDSDVNNPTPTSTGTDLDLITWASPSDPANPKNWSNSYKWILMSLCVIMTVNITLASSALTPASVQIAVDFNVSNEISYLVTSLFLCGYILGPILWGPGSELLGRRLILVITMIAFTLLHLGQSLAPNIQTLLVTRFLSGVFGAGPLSTWGGVIVDIWPTAGRGPSTALFTASVFWGTAIGPLFGSFITESRLGWRWVFWAIMIYAALCTILTVLIFPETYEPLLLQQKAQGLRRMDPAATKKIYAEHERHDWSIKGILRRTLYRPFSLLAMEPILVLITIFLSLEYGVLYGLFEAFPVIFEEKRGLSVSNDSLIFIGIGIGTSIGALLNVYLDGNTPDIIMKWQNSPPPENRLYGAMVGGPLLVVGIFWLGWTGEYSVVPWYIPALSTLSLGASISLVFISFTAYILDTYLIFSASAISATVMIRSCVGAAFPLFTTQMINKARIIYCCKLGMGVNWVATLLGIVGLVLMPSPFLFYKYGARIRSHSKFAPCVDLRIAKELAVNEELNEKDDIEV
ncbi:hypothetical protein PILCRDRAFT_73402 [Piloderma croceum F 1598]|uniref:Major facilitator superfamily (MFS) profile domain-containing protein n=1 Tax=Piloderma croceum (strain F 1598) TaxID=765440 RepID=A0A0C3BSF8_PILCF|nr:hypothetical protein PILCRDRAFT_73402 [Piloderma croceum F 1598]